MRLLKWIRNVVVKIKLRNQIQQDREISDNANVMQNSMNKSTYLHFRWPIKGAIFNTSQKIYNMFINRNSSKTSGQNRTKPRWQNILLSANQADQIQKMHLRNGSMWMSWEEAVIKRTALFWCSCIPSLLPTAAPQLFSYQAYLLLLALRIEMPNRTSSWVFPHRSIHSTVDQPVSTRRLRCSHKRPAKDR